MYYCSQPNNYVIIFRLLFRINKKYLYHLLYSFGDDDVRAGLNLIGFLRGKLLDCSQCRNFVVDLYSSVNHNTKISNRVTRLIKEIIA